ncbi:hypothetical protein F0344_25630 [Streptomyces finlayi]|uniref:DUF3466 family protein n=1 Tax=Streptomyces finlayi TaxID=67296 RepID=A0A7G7BQB4_9ACTN|nr:hypothetical protein [Streptomyces finlayi]QNE77529.1 hypothetical protein F0344_25630 [Streptomyces finlayi]
MRSVLAAATLTAALGLVPVGTSQAAACQWQKTVWELPPTTNLGTLYASDGGRYGVGVTGTRSSTWPYGYKEKQGTLWDNGKVVLWLPSITPVDVNAAGLIAGNDLFDGTFKGVTVTRTGASAVLPFDPSWDHSTADAINDAGDIAGTAAVGSKRILVVWPASAPGTYRELAVPDTGSLTATDIDEQGRIVGYTDTEGFVTDTSGQWHTLAAQGPNGMGTPWAIRDGRAAGSMDNDTSYAAAEWNDQGSLVRTIKNGAISAKAIGGAGTVGGLGFVNSTPRAVLWRNGVVADPLSGVSDYFTLTAISTDEKTLIGSDASTPAQYNCV